MRTYRQLPDIPTGYPIEGARSWWSVVIPLERTNLFTFDTSLETNATNYAAVGSGSIARTTDEQYHGAYSLAITPTATTTDGARAETFNVTAGVTYAFSCKVKGRAGVPYRFYVGDTGGTEQSGIHFKGTGRWQWVTCLWKATAISCRMFLRKDGSADTGIFYWDGLQMESCADGVLAATTYISGDESGLVSNQYPPAYTWSGTRFASTATRSGQTRAGGYVMPLSRYGFILVAMIGLGMISPSIVATSYAQLDGAQYERTVYGPRQFTLSGRLQGTTPRQLDNLRGRLAAALGRDVTGQNQPLTLLYQAWDQDRPISDLGRVAAVYSGGLEGSVDNLVAETAPITFTMFLPTVQADREQGTALDPQDSVSNANRVLLRTAGGTWSALGTGAAGGSVMAIRRGLDGRSYIGGTFTSFNGLANTIAIVRYDPAAGGVIAALGTGAGSGAVYDILVAPNGDIYALGTFQNMGGVAAADYVARWDGSAWNAVGTPSAIGTAVAGIQGTFDTSGNLYTPTVGNSTIREWDGSAWSTLGTVAGGGAIVNAVIRGPNGDLFIGGSFTSVSGVSATNAARYSFSAAAWQALNGSIGETVRSLTFGLDGTLYAGTASVGSDSSFWSWNGVEWTRRGAISGTVFTVATTAAGLIALGGSFTADDGSLPDGLGYWNGSTVIPLDVDLPSTTEVYRIATEVDGAIAVGFNTSGTATAAGLTTVTNSGAVKSYPTLQISGPSSGTARIYAIRNVTTGRSMYFNLSLAAGETARMVFEPATLSFTSSFTGDLAGSIQPGSDEADFFLQPGSNTIALFADDATVSAVLSWRPQYEHIGGLTP